MLALIGPLVIIPWSRTRTLITACCPVPLLQSRALGKTLLFKFNNFGFQFGGIIATVKDLKCSIEELKKRVLKKRNEEIQEIIDAQKVVDEVIVANSDAIKRIDKEIQKILNSRSTAQFNRV